MSDVAGGTGNREGVIYAGGMWDFARNDGYLRMDEQYAVDVFNTFYVDGKYPIAINDRTSLTLGAQYYPQSSVGDEQIGSFDLRHGAAGRRCARAVRRPALLHADRQGIRHAEPLRRPCVLPQPDAGGVQHRRREGLGIGGNLDFADLGVPGLTVAAIYADGRKRIDAQTGSPIPDRHETNVRVDYAIGKGTFLEGLVAMFRYSWLHQDGSPQTQTQLRAYLNYAVRF